MGLPTACLFLEAGLKVVGVDVDERVVELLNAGKSPIEEKGIQPIIEKFIGSTFSVTSGLRFASALCNVIILIVPTLVDAGHKPDYSAVEKACHEIGFKLGRGTLLILESTVAPGITEEVVKPILERNSGLSAGKDFLLAYSPIRAMSGRALKDIKTYPRIVSGLDERSLNAAATVMGTIVKGGIIKVESIKTAEASKLFENVYRDVNIAVANELACFCERIGLDFLKVRAAANSQPFSNLHVPSIGVGGHCIPVNPYFLIASGRKTGMELRLVRYGRIRNDKMSAHTVELVEEALKECGRTIGRSNITVLGMSYRANVKESCNSPSIEVIRRLRRMGGRIRVFDPYYGVEELKEMGYQSSESLERTVQGANCLLIAVGHDQFRDLSLEHLSQLMRKPSSIVDAARVIDPEEAHEHGFIYYGVGYGRRVPDDTLLLVNSTSPGWTTW
jgi:UDP-N-acetyl-D-mannosaminuronic acid dehydrogenase